MSRTSLLSIKETRIQLHIKSRSIHIAHHAALLREQVPRGEPQCDAEMSFRVLSRADAFKVDSLVMVQIVAIEDMGAYVKLVRLQCSWELRGTRSTQSLMDHSSNTTTSRV